MLFWSLAFYQCRTQICRKIPFNSKILTYETNSKQNKNPIFLNTVCQVFSKWTATKCHLSGIIAVVALKGAQNVGGYVK